MIFFRPKQLQLWPKWFSFGLSRTSLHWFPAPHSSAFLLSILSSCLLSSSTPSTWTPVPPEQLHAASEPVSTQPSQYLMLRRTKTNHRKPKHSLIMWLFSTPITNLPNLHIDEPTSFMVANKYLAWHTAMANELNALANMANELNTRLWPMNSTV